MGTAEGCWQRKAVVGFLRSAEVALVARVGLRKPWRALALAWLAMAGKAQVRLLAVVAIVMMVVMGKEAREKERSRRDGGLVNEESHG